MKRRSSLRSDSGQEERRLDGGRNLRRRTSVNYRVDDEDSSEEDDRNQPPTHEDGELWPVTCGDKNGMMDAQKLAKGEECIECEGRMFTPPAFEEFGGRGSAKKWKTSIYSGGEPLQHWFNEYLLSTEGYNRTKTYKKRQSFRNNNVRRRDAQGSGESGEDATDDSENDDGIPSGCRSWLLPWAEEETERNDSDHPGDKEDEEPDEMENDGDGNDRDDEDLGAPQDEESLSDRRCCRTSTQRRRGRRRRLGDEPRRKDKGQRGRDAPGTGGQRDGRRGHKHVSPRRTGGAESPRIAEAFCRRFDSAWFERARRSRGCERLRSIRIADDVGDEKRLRFGQHAHLGRGGDLHVGGPDRFRRGLDGSGAAAERSSENAAGSRKRAKGGFENTEGILRFEIASFTGPDESGPFQFPDAGCDATLTNSGRDEAFPVTNNYKELRILLPPSQEKLLIICGVEL